MEKLRELSPDLIVLAGFLVRIPEEMTREFEGKIINIHPSLIPSFCGVGYYGLKVHEAVLARGAKVTGATVHFVDAGMDEGPIIAQKAVGVEESDTPESLQRQIFGKSLASLENRRLLIRSEHAQPRFLQHIHKTAHQRVIRRHKHQIHLLFFRIRP